MEPFALETASPPHRDEILFRLEREHAVTGAEIYLLPLIPLMEMAWAAGPPAAAERRLVYEFALRLLADVDREAQGMAGLSAERVNRFLGRFLDRPTRDDGLRRLRTLATPLILDAGADGTPPEGRRRAILGYCLDIGAAAVGHYPYGAHERFGPRKKAVFLDIADNLHVPNQSRAWDGASMVG